MSDPIPPAGAPDLGRRLTQRRVDDPPPRDGRGRRGRDKPAADPSPSAEAKLPVAVSARTDKGPSPLESFAAFAAQLLGQGGQKRGLRGGPETLERARSTYLETEWSGPSDRRLHTGRITKTDI